MSRVIDAVLRLKDEFTQPLEKSINLMTQASKAGDKTRRSIEKFGNGMASVGTKLTTAITLPVAAVGTAAVKAATDWETAFTGVKKTVDATEAEYDELGKGIQKMATQTASSMEAIAGVAEVSGQLGISKDYLLDFTRTMVQLGDTTNLSAEEAATSLARLLNITGESTSNVDRLGAAIVDLGNNFATDEASIVAMSTRLASAGTLAGMSTTDILALSTAMSSVGIEAEAGGTAMTQTLTAFESAVAGFSAGSTADLEAIASVAGTSATEFARTWESEPIMAVQSFISGLGKLDEQGESATLVLDELGMSGIRQSNMLKSLGLASDVLSDAVNTSSAAYEANTALTAEAEKRYGTFASRVSQLKEQIKTLGIDIGQILLPYVAKAMGFVQGLVDKFNSLDDSTKDAIIKFALVAAAVGPVLTIFGKMITIGSGLLGAFAKVKGVMAGVSAAGGVLKFAIAALTSPIGLVVAACAAVVAILVLVVTHMDKLKALFAAVKSVAISAAQSLKNKVGGAFEYIAGKVEKVSSLLSAVGGAIGGAASKVYEFATGSESKLSGSKSSGGRSLPGNATGTTNWRGGLTRVNEKGGEIMNLPSGTQIIPHDASRNTPIGGGNITIAKLADSIVVREDADIERIGDAIVRKIKAANGNRGGLTYNGVMA